MDQLNNRTPVFINDQTDIFVGEQAKSLIEGRRAREAALFDPARGIPRVGRERWDEAQRYERRTWMAKARHVASDRNEYHRAHFAGYAPISGRSFERGIELGCGPFTNMRLIVERCDVHELHLLDPLLTEYLEHPFCAYGGGRLGGLVHAMQPGAALRHPATFMRSRYAALRAGGLRGRPVALHTSMIETFETCVPFDLVVMVNVIEHCQDIDKVLRKILELVAPGGTFVFADRLYDAAEVARLAGVLFDAGHPLRVHRSVLLDFLSSHFEALMSAEYSEEQTFRGLHMRGDELYFIGRRCSRA